MAINHGVYVKKQSTNISTPRVAATGIPFVVGRAPIHAAASPATPGVPVLCTSWDDAVSKLGYNENWADFTLCEFMFSHFMLFSMQPCIFLNLLDPVSMKQTVDAEDYTVTDHKVILGDLAMITDALVVKNGEDTLEADTDYAVYYSNGDLLVELLPDSDAYAAPTLNITYEAVRPSDIDCNDVAIGVEKVELCFSMFGLTPDLLCAPGFSHDSTVAAVMAAKAPNINGLFRGKALVDIPSDADSGAAVYSDAVTKKGEINLTDLNEITCWPQGGLGDHKFHLSTQLAGTMASVDAESGTPYASPSNHPMHIDRLITEDGGEVLLTLQEANILNSAGIVTGLNFIGGYKVWGNYTACYPDCTDVKDYFIPVSRMFDWVANTLILTFWEKLDKAMNRRLIDTIMDTANIWLNGLKGSEYLLGARVEMKEEENPPEKLRAGILCIHIYMTPPSPAQEIDFILEYDASYVEQALGS